MDKNALMETDLYELFGIVNTASEQELKKAYRKKALKCHPDKNPDNPNAAKLFLELSTALEILLDVSSRANYDKMLSARLAAKIRHDALDSKRKKLKEDLEAREKSAAANLRQDGRSQQSAEEKYNAEIQRLRKEGSKQLLEEMEKVKEEIREQMSNPLYSQEEDGSAHRLKVRWKCEKTDENDGGYNSTNLRTIFSKYGEISCLVVSNKKKGSALLEFETKSAAIKAYQLERGYSSNPLKLSWLEASAAAESSSQQNSDNYRRCSPLDQCPQSGDLKGGGLFPSFQSKNVSATTKSSYGQSSVNAEEDFEAMVFAKMREAQARKSDSTS
ncbi:dnaJ homolog subfamily C member [Nesidiocoris tenuis]|uniref:DnaJ homolog subfamily C member n=1 Tax=Nesidiocoris tenuis TaxID=355587 RepID=A0ABN7BAT2_9HEMI|nr:dnaJ homolog subfamily C member [Nesidiocoris tenuis]